MFSGSMVGIASVFEEEKDLFLRHSILPVLQDGGDCDLHRMRDFCGLHVLLARDNRNAYNQGRNVLGFLCDRR